jgi:hypothetical protein
MAWLTAELFLITAMKPNYEKGDEEYLNNSEDAQKGLKHYVLDSIL